jgi:hypothetical protein
MSTVKGVTARVAHSCETCDRKTVNGEYSRAILPGHRYLLHTTFPGDEGFEEGTRPQSIRECASCAIKRDDCAATLYGICGSYCHGINPCVLPFVKGAPGHQCVCRECASDPEAVTTR